MPAILQHDRDNIFRIELSGALRKADLEDCQRRLIDEMNRVGPVKLLFVLDSFDGWEPGANWNDLSFYVTYGDRIERIAIVGPEKWRSQTLMFAGADLRRAPVAYFAGDAFPEARTWLAS